MESSNTFFFLFISAIFNLLFTYLTIPTNATTTTLASKYNITAIYTFGDSILDAGNNNALLTLVQSNHNPYGRDFPGHVATGRFTNGKLATDILASSLGLKHVLPAYLDPKTTPEDLLTGVSFASAGSGYDDLTAARTNVLNFKNELGLFEECLMRIRKDVGKEKGSHIVGNAVFVIAGGTNDVVNNFYVLPTRRATFSLSGYHHFLLRNLEGYLRKIYSMGVTGAVSGGGCHQLGVCRCITFGD
ncbi:hypothetical protein Leryth_007424 [Lithospermum erythrorhizon]|nr:hypothetical protein Leryth_007424 [Lithospermum erythrorhizon]